MLEANVHIEVLNIHIHVPNSILIVLAFCLKILDHGSQPCNLICVFLNTGRIPSHSQFASYMLTLYAFNSFYLRLDVFNLRVNLISQIA